MSAHLKYLGHGQSYTSSYLSSAYTTSLDYISTHLASSHPWSFSQFYTQAPNPLVTIFPFFMTTMCGAYVLGLIFQNVSQIDRMWTFLPVVHSLHFALWPWFGKYGEEFAHNKGRVALMVALQFMWSARLSFNTSRRGIFGFFDEDYRWAIWRDLVPGWLFALFHIGFIAIAQSILLVMIALPVQMAVIAGPEESSRSSLAVLRGVGLTGSDVFIALLSVGVLYTQWSADNQQYSFQNYKVAVKNLQAAREGKSSISSSSKSSEPTPSLPEAERHLASKSTWTQEFSLSEIKWTPSDAARGFVQRGLWAWSRHPNFACEQTFWTLQGMIPLLASGGGRLIGQRTRGMLGMHHPLLSGIAISMLFVASTAFTEFITYRKYKEYKSYQLLIGVFVPQATVLQGLFWKVLGKHQELSQRVFGQSRRTQPVK